MGEQFNAGVVINGDSSGAVKAITVFKGALDEATRAQVESAKRTAELKEGVNKLSEQFIEFVKVGAEFAGLSLTIEKIFEGTIESTSAIAKLNAVFNANGGQVGLARGKLDEYAESLNESTSFTTAAIKNSEALLLTFNKITSVNFERALRDATDLSAVFGTDLPSASRLLGKALQDPAEGLTALNREGIRFDEGTQDSIKAMEHFGETTAAQSLLLQELEARTKGAAEALSNSLGGAVTQLKKNFDDLFDVSGHSNSIDSVTGSIKGLADQLKDPAVASGLQTLSALILDVFGGITFAVGASVSGFRHFVEEIASLVNTDLTDQLSKVNREIAAAEAKQVAYFASGGLLFESFSHYGEKNQAYIASLQQQRAALEALANPTKTAADKEAEKAKQDREGAEAALKSAAANVLLSESTQRVIEGLDFGLEHGADPAAIVKSLGVALNAQKLLDDQAEKNAQAFEKLHSTLVELSGAYDVGVAALNKYQQQNVDAAKAVLDHSLSAAQLAGIQNTLTASAGKIYEANLKNLTQQAEYDTALQSSSGAIDRVAVAQAAYRVTLDEIAHSGLSASAADLARQQSLVGLNNALSAVANDGLKKAADALDQLNLKSDLFGNELTVLAQRLARGSISADGYVTQLKKIIAGSDEGNKALNELNQGLDRVQQALAANVVDPSTGLQLYSEDQAAADRRRLYALFDLASRQTAETTDLIGKDYTTAFDQLEGAIRGVTTSWGKAVEGFAAGYRTILDYNAKQFEANKKLADLQVKYQDQIDSGQTGLATKTYDQIVDQKNAIADLAQFRMAIEDQANAQIASSAASLFGRQTTAYKVLDSVSQAYHAAELARTVAELLPKGVSAILTQGEGDPYSAFARIAAMTALVASLGVHVGGGSAAPAPNSTQTDYGSGKGTVLGDLTKQSTSISDALNHLQVYANKGLDYAQAQLQQLQSINSGINGFGALLVQSNLAAGGATPFNTAGRVSLNAPSIVNTAASLNIRGIADVVTGGLNELLGNALGGVFSGLTNKIIGGLFGHKSVSQSATGLEFGGEGLGGLQATVGDALAGQDVAAYYETLRTHKSGGLLGNSSTRYDTFYAGISDETSRQIDKIIGGLGSSVLSAITELGGNVTQAQSIINALPLDIGKVNLQGLTGDALTKQINAVFSALGDRIAGAASASLGNISLTKFQQSGEGLLTTLVRVASDFDYASSVEQKLHLSTVQLTDAFADQTDLASALIKASVDATETVGGVESGLARLSDAFSGSATDLAAYIVQLYQVRGAMVDVGADGQQLSATLVNAAGSLDALKSGLGNYFSNFLSAQQQTDAEGANLTRTLGNLNLSLPGTRAGFVSLINSLDLTTDAGKTAYGSLISISDQFDTYYKGLEQQASAALSAQKALVSGLQSFAQASAGVAAQIKGLSESFNTASALNALGSSTDLASRSSAGNSLEQLIQSSYSSQVTAITSARDTQIAAINSTLQTQIQALQSQAQAQAQINQQVAQAQSASQQLALQAYQQMQTAAQNLLTFANQLDTSSLAPGTPFDQLAANKSLFESLVQKAKGGDANAASQIVSQGQALLNLAQNIYGSTNAYQALFSEVRNTSAALGKSLAGQPAPEQQAAAALSALQSQSLQTNDILNRQIANAQADAQAQIDAINKQSNVALQDLQNKSLDALAAVENAVLSGNVDLQNLIDEISLGNSTQEALLQSQLATLQQLDSSLAASATSGAALPHFAAGGIATTPSIFGEAGPEAAIPLQGGAVPVRLDSAPLKAIVTELQTLRQQVAQQSGDLHLQVVTTDGKVLVDQTLAALKNRSKRGQLVVYANGIG